MIKGWLAQAILIAGIFGLCLAAHYAIQAANDVAHQAQIQQRDAQLRACRDNIELLRIAINDAAIGDTQTAEAIYHEVGACQASHG